VERLLPDDGEISFEGLGQAALPLEAAGPEEQGFGRVPRGGVEAEGPVEVVRLGALS